MVHRTAKDFDDPVERLRVRDPEPVAKAAFNPRPFEILRQLLSAAVDQKDSVACTNLPNHLSGYPHAVLVCFQQRPSDFDDDFHLIILASCLQSSC